MVFAVVVMARAVRNKIEQKREVLDFRRQVLRPGPDLHRAWPLALLGFSYYFPAKNW